MSLSPLLPSFIFPSLSLSLSLSPPFSLVFQLSGSGPRRTKRQAVVDDAHDTTQSHVIEPQATITLVTGRKETHLLVRNGSAWAPSWTAFTRHWKLLHSIVRVRSSHLTSPVRQSHTQCSLSQVKESYTDATLSMCPHYIMNSEVTLLYTGHNQD